ncbi:MAG: SDR family NAD(P)-dependent oxidoreductase [Coriobacteriia bacterium]
MAGRLDGKVVVITGSTRGIGRVMAEACADAGATVVVSSRTASAVEATVAVLQGRGAKVSGIPCDVADPTALEALLAHAVATHGSVDVWVNNAGVSLGLRTHVDTTPDEIRSIVDINLVGTMMASRMVVPYFIGHGGGVLINVSGRGGKGDAAAYTAAYAATKAGVMVFTRSLAAEHRSDPVSILVFMPGMVDTDFYGADMDSSRSWITSASCSMPSARPSRRLVPRSWRPHAPCQERIRATCTGREAPPGGCSADSSCSGHGSRGA